MNIIKSIILIFAILFISTTFAFANDEEASSATVPAELEKNFNIDGYTRWLPPSSVQALPGHIGIIEAGGEAKYDFKIFGELPLSFSGSFDYINIEKTIPKSIPAALINPGVTLETKLPLFNIKNAYIGTSINPSFSCDMNSFGASSFLIPTTFVIIYVPNSKLTLICGPQFFTDFNNDVQIVGGMIYRPTDKITLNLTTTYPHITYKINDKLDLLAEGQWVLYNQYKVRINGDDNVLLKYREAWVGGGFRFRPIKYTQITLSAGGVFNRQLRFYHAGQKIDIDKGFYLQSVAEINF